MQTLASIDDEDLEIRILVEDLLYPSIVATFSGQLSRLLLLAVFSFIIVAEVGGSRSGIELAGLESCRGGGLVANYRAI